MLIEGFPKSEENSYEIAVFPVIIFVNYNG